MFNSIVSYYHFGKRSGAWDMTIFESHVSPCIPNIGYIKVYGGIWAYMEVYEGICRYMKYIRRYMGA